MRCGTSKAEDPTYFGAKSNTGFNLYESKHHYKGHDYEHGFEDANSFVIEISSSGEMQ